MLKRVLKISIFAFLLLFVSCSTLIGGLADSLYQQRDVQLVKDGAPAFLLIVEGLISGDPGNRDNLLLGIQLFSAYSSAFVEDDERSSIFLDKGKEWSMQLLQTYPHYKKAENGDFDQFEKAVLKFKKKDVSSIFWAANAWIYWILGNTDDLSAFMDLPKAKALIDRVYELDDTYYYGAPHLFYGIYYSAIPAMMGGNLEKGKEEFEKALEISDGRLLMVKSSYAEYYFKATYDRDSFESILNEVIEADVDKVPETRLLNLIAQKKAQHLLDTIDEFFFEDDF